MNAKELMKEALAKKLEGHSKEELIDMITEVASAYLLAKMFTGVSNFSRVNDTIDAISTNVQNIKESLTEQEVKEDFRRFCTLKDVGMF